MKDNTLRNEIWLLCDHQVSLHKQADDLTNAVLAAFEARLPKEQIDYSFGLSNYDGDDISLDTPKLSDYDEVFQLGKGDEL